MTYPDLELEDRVKLKNHPHYITGTVQQISLDGKGDFIYTVLFDEPDLIPPYDNYPRYAIELMGKATKPECVCGVDSVGAGKHSDWCSKSRWN